MSHMSDEKAAQKLLSSIRRSSLLKPLADSTTHVQDTYPSRHHASLGNAHQVDCDYKNLFTTLYGDTARLSVSKETKAALAKDQAKMRLEWRITGTKVMPWPIVKFYNLILRLLNVVIDLVSIVMSKRRVLTWHQSELLKAETSDATNAAPADGSNMLNVCQELLIKHPFAMTEECQNDLQRYVYSKYRTIAIKLVDDADGRSHTPKRKKL